MKRFSIVAGLVLAALQAAVSGPVAATASPDSEATDVRVSNGSPATPFPLNKQNEPAITVNPVQNSVLVAGSNDEIDNAPCQGSHCGFTPGVTDNGLYVSFDTGQSWTQPTYSGWSGRTGTPAVGPTGTVPWFYESGLVGDGDPALAFGPVPGPGGFSWKNGSRLYYSSLASNFPGTSTTVAQEVIAVSSTDNLKAAAKGVKTAWKHPVIASNLVDANTFSDKEAIWADNAASSPHFGSVYVCWTSFGATNSPIVVARSTDGGQTWSNPVTVFDFVPTATTGPTSCTMRTDSTGKVYVFWEQVNSPLLSHMMMARSSDGGATFGAPRNVADVTEVGRDDPVHTANGDPRVTFDGVGGARTFSGLQVDVANGAPTGNDATNQLVMSWSDARKGLNKEEALVQTSRSSGDTWTGAVAVQQPGDRPDFPAIAISPDGRAVYLTYDAFTTPWQNDTRQRRRMLGVVRGATVSATGVLRTFTTLHRGRGGDARGASENNLCCEFLGDYNYVVATRSFGAAVWNDVRDAAPCIAVDKWRQSLLTTLKPAPPAVCPPTFGNTDIYGGAYTLPEHEGE